MQAASTQQRSGFLIINSEPQGAEVWLNNESTGEVTPFRRKLAIGDEVPYRLSLPLYHDEAGMVTVDQPRKELHVRAAPGIRLGDGDVDTVGRVGISRREAGGADAHDA